MGGEGDPFAHLAVGMALFEGSVSREVRADRASSNGFVGPTRPRARTGELRRWAIELAIAVTVGMAACAVGCGLGS